jgi:hypothetical protein
MLPGRILDPLTSTGGKVRVSLCCAFTPELKTIATAEVITVFRKTVMPVSLVFFKSTRRHPLTIDFPAARTQFFA